MKSEAIKTSRGARPPDRPAWARDLLRSLEAQPIQPGYDHPGEEILRQAIQEDWREVEQWFRTMLGWPEARLLADQIKCLGRMEPAEIGSWGVRLAREALQHSDLGVRDEAIQALEQWDTPEAYAVLRAHHEALPWLQEYVERLVRDFDTRPHK